jgi:hypothetical protein
MVGHALAIGLSMHLSRGRGLYMRIRVCTIPICVFCIASGRLEMNDFRPRFLPGFYQVSAGLFCRSPVHSLTEISIRGHKTTLRQDEGNTSKAASEPQDINTAAAFISQPHMSDVGSLP